LAYSVPTRASRYFFLSTIPLRPRSTLFPYTTLFRSKVNPLRLHAELGTVGDREPRWAVARKFAPEVRVTKLLEIKINVGRTGSLDRKSTRLNSSHEWISYAVFCLKKKTTKTNKRTHV